MRIRVDAEAYGAELEPLIAVLAALVGDAMMDRLSLDATVDRVSPEDIVVTIVRRQRPFKTLD